MNEEYDPTYTLEDLDGLRGILSVEKDVGDGVECVVLSFIEESGEVYCLNISCEDHAD